MNLSFINAYDTFIRLPIDYYITVEPINISNIERIAKC